MHGGTWGDEPNFGADLRYYYEFLAVNVGYVFADTVKETFHIAAGVIPYSNDWFRCHALWGVVLNDREQAKLIVDTWFKIDPVWVTVGVQSVQNNAYFNAGITMKIESVFDKRKTKRRFY
jgi:hypothetical protein